MIAHQIKSTQYKRIALNEKTKQKESKCYFIDEKLKNKSLVFFVLFFSCAFDTSFLYKVDFTTINFEFSRILKHSDDL